MENYNSLISAKILDGYEEMLGRVPQETMFGGKRMRQFVLPSSTEYDYPASLSVGTMDGKTPQTLAGAFFKDFNQGFPVNSAIETPNPVEKKGGAVVGNKVVVPVGNPRRVGGKIPKALKALGKVVAPVAKDVGMMVAKEGIKEGVKTASKSGGKRKKATEVVEQKTDNLRKFVSEAVSKVGKGRKSKKMVGTDPKTYTPSHLMPESEVEGGALIKNNPDEFHSSVYPPALASYASQMPKGKDAFGRGRSRKTASDALAPVQKAKRTSARGAIVKKVMKEKGLSLAEASKFVKANSLY